MDKVMLGEWIELLTYATLCGLGLGYAVLLLVQWSVGL
ncbi:TMhelix containing protein [Vibrio phage 275E43-1]|nr:TMhelix containing protein [Vibrio phage 275E43-1]